MSLPDGEPQFPNDQDERKPQESEADWTGESLELSDDLMGDSLFDAGAAATPSDGSDSTLDFASPVDSESGLAFQAMGMDDEEAAPAEMLDETLDLAAPADTGSGLGFGALATAEGEAEISDEGAEGDAFLAAAGGGLDDFGVDDAALDTGIADIAEEDEEDAKKPAKGLLHRVLSAVGGTDPYTVLMGIALVALLCGILFFYLELASYDFDIGAEKAKQLVGLAGFGWLL